MRSSFKAASAIKSVFQISLEVLIEEYKEGLNFRATLVGFNQIAVALRLPPSIIGDGKSTISQLIEAKNSDKYRGETGSRNYPLHKIPINEFLLSRLHKHQLNLATVLAKGLKYYLSEKINLASGADIHDVTSTVHPHNRALFERAQDLGVSYKVNPLYIVEANPKPFFEMHHFPTEGEAKDVAGALASLYAQES